MSSLNAASCLGTHNVLLATLDTLRFDVAVSALKLGSTPNFERLLPEGGWEQRHTPSSFTYGAHHAFFAGFLPTPVIARHCDPAPHNRLFAAQFPGSETSALETLVFDTPDIVSGFAANSYHTLCVGGTGFFNKTSPLGSVLPGLFSESHWEERFGVTSPNSAAEQVACLREVINARPDEERIFAFVNFSACHPPHKMFVNGAVEDTADTQQAALASIDAAIPDLVEALCRHAPTLMIFTSDHGTAFGEDGYDGHRIGHPVVWTVPYAERILEKGSVL